MRPDPFVALVYGGLALSLTVGTVVAARKAIRRIRGLGREDPATLRRLGMIRFGAGSIALLGVFLSGALLMLQVDVWVGLFGSSDDVIGVFAFLLSLGSTRGRSIGCHGRGGSSGSGFKITRR